MAYKIKIKADRTQDGFMMTMHHICGSGAWENWNMGPIRVKWWIG